MTYEIMLKKLYTERKELDRISDLIRKARFKLDTLKKEMDKDNFDNYPSIRLLSIESEYKNADTALKSLQADFDNQYEIVKGISNEFIFQTLKRLANK